MTKQTISELLEESGSDTISYRGRVVRALVRIPVKDGSLVKVKRESVNSPRLQALKISVNKGALDINGHREPVISLWSHTSPDEVEFTVRGREVSVLEVWNAWSMGGVDTSWIGNSGIVTKTSAKGQQLQCSDGIGQATFSDLVANIEVID
ncbi:MAG: hypothetical protein CL457_03915 [Acidimicrobiaceae bacterium]|nr:hypothetical protein [Acidimicrobiaceae bacterium]|tara:strand:- start:8268 stop:8720 length:453 start_codon:yes stop_codon:yes gene_type:complete